MKLSDIVVEAEPEGKAAMGGDKLIELKDVIEYFPNTYQRAMKSLAKDGRLTFGGQVIFTKSGEYGPALERATAEAEQVLDDEDNMINIVVEMDGSVADLDDGTDFEVQMPISDKQEVYIGYMPRYDKLIIGFDAWGNEEAFNEEWDKEFERTFGEPFNMDDDKHEKIYNKAWKEFRDHQSLFGLMVTVDSDFHAEFDDAPVEGGFHSQTMKRMLASRRVIDFDLS